MMGIAGNLAKAGLSAGANQFNRAYRPTKWLVDQVNGVLAGHGVWQLNCVNVVEDYAVESFTAYFALARQATLKDAEKFSGIIASSLGYSQVWDVTYVPGGLVSIVMSTRPKPSYAASSTALGNGAVPEAGVHLFHHAASEPIGWFSERGAFTPSAGAEALLSETYAAADAIRVLGSEQGLFDFFRHCGLTRTRTVERRNPDGSPHSITVTDAPEVVLIEWLRDGLSAVFKALPGQTVSDWSKAMNRPDFRSVLRVRMEHDEQEVLTGDA